MTMAIKLETVRSRMQRPRKALSYSNSPKIQRFCKDPAVFNWACRMYRYTYNAFHGNVEGINEDTYAGFYTIVTDKTNYEYTVASLKEDIENMSRNGQKDTEAVYLLKTLMTLRKEYR